MKQVEIELEEILRMINAMEKSNSCYLKNDYAKNIRYRIGELRYYCKHKGIDYNVLVKEFLGDKKR